MDTTSKSEDLIRSYLSQIYTETVVDHSLSPRNLGMMDNPDGYTRHTSSCGDTLNIWLRVKDDIINEATFTTDGCSATVAVGSMVTELAGGKTIAEARRISPQDILTSLGGLPPVNEHCALLAATALSEAIVDYELMKRDPWKKAYRKF